MKQKSQKKIAAKEEKRRKHRRRVEIVREATKKAFSTPNAPDMDKQEELPMYDASGRKTKHWKPPSAEGWAEFHDTYGLY